VKQIACIRKLIRQNWDELAIATALGHVASEQSPAEVESHYSYIFEAIRRSETALHHADAVEIQHYVSSLGEDQLPGFVSNIKGIANEVYFVEAENHDGNTVHAYLFDSTNHPDYDVLVHDSDTGKAIDLQLKATDSAAYVREAVEQLGADHVAVTQELADQLGLQSTGISNEQLEHNVLSVMDDLGEDHSLWDYVPGLTTWSVALDVASLSRRYCRGELTRENFAKMVAVCAGAKAVKIALIMTALSIPGLNVITTAGLFLKMAYSLRGAYSVERDMAPLAP